jgi:hypothetical protein
MKNQSIRSLIVICAIFISAANLLGEPLASTPSRSYARELGFPTIYPIYNPKTRGNTHIANLETANTVIFMPFVSHDRQVSDIRSPFSLQIAALHQVLPNSLADEFKSSVSLPSSASSSSGAGAFESLISALKESGADWTRVRVEWENIEISEPVPGQPPDYYWQYYDQALGLVADADVRIIATLADSPDWAADIPCAPIYPDRLDEFARYLTDLVNHYKGPPFYIQHWELINEPDSNRYTDGHLSGHGCWAYDGDQYAQTLAVGYQAIKAADPRATVLFGGIAYDWFEEYGGPFYRYFPDEVMENGGGSYIDALNLHYYPDFHAEWDRWNPSSDDRKYGWIPAPTCGIVDDGVGTPYDVYGFDVVAKTSHFSNRMNACHGVSKPIWLTEVGAHGYEEDPDSLERQAQDLIKIYARSISAGIKNIPWFSLDEPPYEHFGQALLDPDFSPKPAFFAYQTLTRELDGYYEYIRDQNSCSWVSEGVTCSVEAYIFKNDAQAEKTVAWGSRALIFESNKINVVDRNGVEVTIVDGDKGDSDGKVNGKIRLKLSDEPVFIETW